MAEGKNIDSLLVNAQAPVTPVQAAEQPENVSEVNESATSTSESPTDHASGQSESSSADEYGNAPTASDDSKEATKSSENVEKDEYGNSIAQSKARMYTEEEVNRMIRERLQRGNHAHSSPKEVKEATENFQADPNSNESWEAQLEQFIDKTLEKKQQQRERESWEREEKSKQAEFETKFRNGMGRYKDFHEVVANKPITDTMMLATRSMKDPAAFIYAASKNYGKELERIAQIKDPYYQAAEIGRLEERMRKNHANASNAPRPIQPSQGDMGDKGNTRPNLDARIHQYGRNKFRR